MLVVVSTISLDPVPPILSERKSAAKIVPTDAIACKKRVIFIH